jgi:hypothetical protein
MLKNLIKSGLPGWFYTWKTVAAIALLGPIAVMLIGSAFSAVASFVVGPSRHAPGCFTMQYAAPLRPGSKKFDPHNEDVIAVAASRDKAVGALQDAVHACRPDRCGRSGREGYRKAAIGYMSARGWAAQQLFIRYGEEGLEYANRIYFSARDIELVNELREGFAAGLLDISRLHGNEAAVRMLLFKPLTRFKLCRAQ